MNSDAVTMVRRNAKHTLRNPGAMIMTIYGIVAAIAEPSAVGGFSAFSRFSRNQAQSQAELNHQLNSFGHQLAGLLVTYLILIVASQLLTGMLTVVIGRSVLGDRVTIGQAWRQTLPRLPAMLGATVLFLGCQPAGKDKTDADHGEHSHEHADHEHGHGEHAHGEHGHQTLPAGENLRVIAVISEQVDSPFDGVRAVISERGSLHGTSRERAASRSSAFRAAGCICAFRFLRQPRPNDVQTASRTVQTMIIGACAAES